MKYSISRSSIDTGKEIVIKKNEFVDLQKARLTLNAGLAIEEKYEVVIGNYEDFEKEIVDTAIDTMLYRPRGYKDLRRYIARLNKRQINLLTSTRLYVDHIKQRISDIIPEPSQGKDKVKELFSGKYDSHLEYRFMEALRNYVQHCGFPVHHTAVQAWKTMEDQDRSFLYTIDFASEKKWLKKDKVFKKSVLDEIDDKIDLKQMTRKYIECLSEIHDQVRVIISLHLTNDRNLIEGYINQFSEKNDGSSIGVAAKVFDDEGTKIDEIPLLLEWDDLRIDLINRNRILTNLSRRYVVGGSKRA